MGKRNKGLSSGWLNKNKKKWLGHPKEIINFSICFYSVGALAILKYESMSNQK